MNAIIGCATGYSFEQIQPFMLSAQRWCPQNKVVIFTDQSDAYEGIAAHNAHIMPVSLKWPWMPDYIQRENHLGGLRFDPNIHIVCSRFAMFFAYMMAHGNEYDQVLITDVRDVLFAGDPFAFGWDRTRCNLIRECEEMTVGKCPYNSQGVGALSGQLLEEIKDLPIICSGVMIGEVGPLTNFLREMCKMFSYAPCDRMLTDQVITQAIAHQKPDMVRQWASMETPVFHAGYFKPIPPDWAGRALIHQLDRFPALYARAKELLA